MEATNQPAPRKSGRWLLVLAILWWALLAMQVWSAWELNEAYASCLPLLAIGPETPFALAGMLGGLIGALTSLRRRAWGALTILLGTAAMSVALLVASPVMLWGSMIYLWRHESAFLAEVQSARATLVSGGEPRADMPAREHFQAIVSGFATAGLIAGSTNGLHLVGV